MRSVLLVICAGALGGCHLVSGLTDFELGEGGSSSQGPAAGGSGAGVNVGGGSVGGGGSGPGGAGTGVAGGELLWATSFASNSHERGRGIATAGDTRVAVTASFYGSLELDMPGQEVVSNGGSQDAALIQLDGSTGAVAGTPFSIGGNGEENPQAIAFGPDGSRYLCGSYTNPFTFAGTTTDDPGTGGVTGGFVAAWGPNGMPRWVRTFLSSGELMAACHGVVADATGVYAAGFFTESLSWEGSTQNASGQCGFVVELGNDGSAGDVAVLDANVGTVTIHGIALAGAGAPVITGELEGSIGNGFALTYVGNLRDLFVVQLDDTLAPVWQEVIGGPGTQSGEWVAGNGAGEVVVGAIYEVGLPVLGSDHTAVAGEDSAVVAYDSQGTPQWVRPFRGTGQDRIRSVALDEVGETFVGLGFEGTLDFDGVMASAENNESDALVARLASDGSLVWHVQLGGPGYDMVWGVTERDGVVLATGEYRSPTSIAGVALKEDMASNWWVAAFAR